MYIHCRVTSVTAVPGLIPLSGHTQCFTCHDRCDHICNSIQTHVVNNSFAREQLIEDLPAINFRLISIFTACIRSKVLFNLNHMLCHLINYSQLL